MTRLEPAEHLQAEPAKEANDFWLGFFAGAGTVLFWVAAYTGLRLVGAFDWLTPVVVGGR